MNKIRVQRQSEGLHKGEPFSHRLAVTRVIRFWNKYGISTWQVIRGLGFPFNDEFIARQKIRRCNREFMGHAADISMFVDRYNHTKGYYEQHIKLIIEVDGERHSSNTVQINDGIFETFIEEEYSGTVKVIRLRKDELLGNTKDVEEYLRDELAEWLA
jgi:very-short-patch-repair endonuclease